MKAFLSACMSGQTVGTLFLLPVAVPRTLGACLAISMVRGKTQGRTAFDDTTPLNFVVG
jgi:anaerobic C4-dicarboxylate transporter